MTFIEVETLKPAITERLKHLYAALAEDKFLAEPIVAISSIEGVSQ
jgi:hypothetical protein